MKNLNAVGMALVTLISLSAFGAQSKFNKQVSELTGIFGLKAGSNETKQVKGLDSGKSACTIFVDTVTNGTDQGSTIKVSINAGHKWAVFSFNQRSEVTQYVFNNTTGATHLKIVANNRTGMGDDKMSQFVEIIRGSNRYRTVEVTVSNFDGTRLVCKGPTL